MDPAELSTLTILLVALVGVLWRPFGSREWMWTVGGAATVLLAGFLSLADARSTVADVAGVLAFLVGVAVVAELTSAAGVFEQVAFRLAGRARGSTVRLFTLVFGLTAFATSVFSLDGAVVVMTPVVVQLAAISGVSLLPLAFCVVFVANCGSMLFPVSNLTNLLAVQQLDVGFFDYTGRVWLAALLILLVTWIILRLWFRRELRASFTVAAPPRVCDPVIFTVAATVCLVMLPMFLLAGILGWPMEYVALGAALILATVSLWRGRSGRVIAATVPWQVLFFVLGLFLVVAAARDNGLGAQVNTLLTAISGTGFWDGAATTGISALLANVVNNLPAYLILAPGANPEQLYSVLVGVNAGPMLTPLGSLATVLWLHLLAKDGAQRPSTGAIFKLGVVATPPILLAGALGLWLIA